MAGQKADESDVRIGARLRDARYAAGLSQRALAGQLGFSPAQLQKYENGTNCINASCLQRAAVVLGVNVLAFYDPPEVEHFPQSRGLLGRALSLSGELAKLLEECGASALEGQRQAGAQA